MKIILKVLFILIILNFIFTDSLAMSQIFRVSLEGKVAKDFNLPDLSGKNISLSSFRVKKQLILFFWTTWCPHCRREIKTLNEIYPEVKNKDVEILAIDIGESKARINLFLEKNPVDFSVLLDREQDLVEPYKLIGVPTFIFIDMNGKIIFHDNYFPEDYRDVLFK